MKAAMFSAILLVCLGIQGSLASIFKAYQLGNFQGNIHEIKTCGQCYSTHYRGSYEWIGEAHQARAYNTQNCMGDTNELMPKNYRGNSATSVGFYSVKIDC